MGNAWKRSFLLARSATANATPNASGRSGGALRPPQAFGGRQRTASRRRWRSLNNDCDCGDRLPRYRCLMTARIDYDVYRGPTELCAWRLWPGAGLPAHVKRKDWVLMPKGKSPLHSDADRDVGIHGYCFFQVVEG